jgi:hypothetical protein
MRCGQLPKEKWNRQSPDVCDILDLVRRSVRANNTWGRV